MSHENLEPLSFPCAFLGVQRRRLSSSSSFAAMLAGCKVVAGDGYSARQQGSEQQ